MKTVNKRTHKPTENDVYIGRGAAFGNPFVIGKDGNRDEVCDKFEEQLFNGSGVYEVMRQIIDEGDLDGMNLVCFCAPERCHGESFMKYRCREQL